MPTGKPIPPLPIRSPSATSPDPLFNSEDHTQGGLPHLLQLLTEEYRAYFAQINEQRKQEGQQPLDPEPTLRSAKPLLDFFEQYLRTHRPVQCFAIDYNYGLVLSNNQRLAVSPGVPAIQGTMQDSGAISVTHGRAQPGQEGVVPVG